MMKVSSVARMKVYDKHSFGTGFAVVTNAALRLFVFSCQTVAVVNGSKLILGRYQEGKNGTLAQILALGRTNDWAELLACK